MTPYTERLYHTLPAIYRVRDEQQGGPLRALLDILGAQADAMEADIARLYDNWFIETCDPWVVPYLGELFGVRGLHGVSDATFNPRALVANTLRFRRRKGTAAMLEQLARDVTGWNARVVEFFQRLGTTQYLNHLRPAGLRTPDLRDGAALELVDSPFDATRRTAEVRCITAGRGRYNLPNVGLFLWRLQACPVRRAPAFDHGGNRYSFSQLGHDLPLFNPPVTETDVAHLAEERNVPGRLRRRPLYQELEAWRQALVDKRVPEPAWFGSAPVFEVFLDGSNKAVPPEEIRICHLGEWSLPPDKKTYQRVKPNGTVQEVDRAITVAVDPELGRLTFPAGVTPARVEVSYACGFSSDLGGGCYDREPVPPPAGAREYFVGQGRDWATLQEALDDWAGGDKPAAIFRIQDSAFHSVALDLVVPAGRTLEIRADLNAAREQQRPVLRLASALRLAGAAPPDDKTALATVILDGLWLTGNQVQVQPGSLGALMLRHCTLVPGWGLNLDGSATSPGQPSLSADAGNVHLAVTLARCITGPLLLAGTEELTVRDSIVAADGGQAIEAGTLVLERSTVFGSVNARAVELASNSLFTGPVVAARRQQGCVRFCALPRESQVPRRYRCQPDLAIARATEAARAQGRPGLTAQEEATIAARLKPAFDSEHYSRPDFARLRAAGPREMLTGADDESELGVFHHLRAPQREANLRASLDEYLRAGLQAGIFFVD